MFSSKNKDYKAIISRSYQYQSSTDDGEHDPDDRIDENATIIKIEHVIDNKELRLFGVRLWSSTRAETTTTR